jgi:hypothetical protein
MKVYGVEGINNDYEFRYIAIVCSSRERAEQKQKELTDKERESNKGRPPWVNTEFYIREWELDKENEMS